MLAAVDHETRDGFKRLETNTAAHAVTQLTASPSSSTAGIAAPTSADGDLEDIQLAVRGAPLAQDADWLPAIEQFGEGIFVHFDEAAIGEWLNRDATQRRNDELMTGYGHWCTRFSGHAPHYPGTRMSSCTASRTRSWPRSPSTADIRRVR
jgi:hypothetical protein